MSAPPTSSAPTSAAPSTSDSKDFTQSVDIYALCEGGEVRYIGKAKDSAKRLKTHIRDAQHRRTPVAAWIRKVGMPELAVLERVAERDWPEAERFWIQYLRGLGARLLNIAEGGDQPHQTLEQRASAGRAAVVARMATPRAKRMYEMRRRMGKALHDAARRGDFATAYRLRFRCKVVGTVVPELRGWAASL